MTRIHTYPPLQPPAGLQQRMGMSGGKSAADAQRRGQTELRQVPKLASRPDHL